jgi:NOP5NT (NUC127) domain
MSHVEDYSSTLTVLVFGSVEIPISGFHLQHNFFFYSSCSGKFKDHNWNQSNRKGNHIFTMGLFVLSETSAGLALFKAKDKKILKKDDFSAEVETAEGINSL